MLGFYIFGGMAILLMLVGLVVLLGGGNDGF